MKGQKFRLEEENLRASVIPSSSVALDRYMCPRVVGTRADPSAPITAERPAGWEKHQRREGDAEPLLGRGDTPREAAAYRCSPRNRTPPGRKLWWGLP